MPKRGRTDSHSHARGSESPVVVLSQSSVEMDDALPDSSQRSVISVSTHPSIKVETRRAVPIQRPVQGVKAPQDDPILVADDEEDPLPVAGSDEEPGLPNGSTDALTRRIYLNPARPELGWIVRARLPDIAVVMSRAGFSTLLASKPDKMGLIQMYGRVISVPRYQQAFLRDYSFTGMPHFAEKVLPPGVQEVFDWANSQRHLWTADEVDQGGLKQKPNSGGEGKKGKSKSDPMASMDSKVVTIESKMETPAVESENTAAAAAGIPLFNSSLINWYMDGTHYIGTHADDERQLVPLSPIFTASLGATRLFRIRQKEDGKIVKDLYVKNGDILVMGGAMQKHFKHEIVKLSEAKGKLLGPRISLTFRQFVE
jgi:alkylated DNA repair dioxygenase AlkB